MSTLSWGKCTIKYAVSESGAPTGDWAETDTPKEDTTKLTPTNGTEKTATEEGGAVVDYMAAKNTYDFEFDLFVKKGKDAPFKDDDGVVDGEWAFKVIPQDDKCFGIQIDRCSLRVDVSYAAADGILLHHSGKCLKAAEGNTVKRLNPDGTVVSSFAGADESDSSDTDAEEGGN